MRTLVLPGIDNSGAAHWQTLWEAQDDSLHRVNQANWSSPVCEEWVATLRSVVDAAGANVVLVAHSLGCLLVAHWAARYAGRIKGALLVAPPDPDGPNFPSVAKGFSPVPLGNMPFRSILVCSSDDPYCQLERATAFAMAWGSEFINIGAHGHINGQSGLGNWEAGRKLLQRLAV